MDQESAIDRIEDTLDQLNDRLAVPGFEQSDPGNYKLLRDNYNQLSDKRDQLTQAEFSDDDAEFQKLTVDLNAAADKINDDIKSQQRIDDLITDTTKLLDTVDEILKLV